MGNKTTYRPGATQNISYLVTSVESTSAVSAQATVLRLHATTDCAYKLGVTGGAAVVTDTFLPAGAIEYIGCNPGEFIHAIYFTGSSNGTLNITEMS